MLETSSPKKACVGRLITYPILMATTQVSGPQELQQAYRRVTDRIAEAAHRSGRRAKDILFVAVTKYASPDQIRSLVELGHTDLGESQVQQLSQRVASIKEFLARKRTLPDGASKITILAGKAPTRVRWHMIGHLQRNKIKPVLPLVQLIHSVDSLRLAEELHAQAARTDRVMDILIQVNSSGEASKFGVAPPAVSHLAEQIDTMIHLRFRGLMVMAPRVENPEDARPIFTRTAELFHELCQSKIGGPNCNILSMGMSNDFEVAIEEGSNVVRLGRALFGESKPG